MPIPERVPSMIDSLRALLGFGVEIGSVLDVGILNCTYPLMLTCGDKKHHLFEPVELFSGKIHEAYKNIEHDLHNVALSDSEGTAWQVHLSSDGSGMVTHSTVSEEPVSVRGSVVGCTPVRKTTLDSYIKNVGSVPPYLLKLDVDGHEIPILKGAASTLKKTNVVAIEATIENIHERLSYLTDHGFKLFDIVEPAYYEGALWQVDLIFINKSLLQKNKKLNPMRNKDHLNWDAWYDYAKRQLQ